MRLCGGGAHEREGLARDEVAPRPWSVAPIRYDRGGLRVLDAAGREVIRMRRADALFVVALANGVACTCPEAHEPGCPVARGL